MGYVIIQTKVGYNKQCYNWKLTSEVVFPINSREEKTFYYVS